MGNIFNTYKSTSEKILIEGIDKETGVTTSITVEPKAYEVLTEYFKERAKAECWHESSGLNKPDVSNSVCSCGSPNYGYGFAKCFDCGKIKDV